MAKKIDNSVLEYLKDLCYKVVFGEMSTQTTRSKARDLSRKYLDNNGYKINWVKCDEENNPPDIIDSNQMIIHISEEEFPGSCSEITHKIIL